MSTLRNRAVTAIAHAARPPASEAERFLRAKMARALGRVASLNHVDAVAANILAKDCEKALLVEVRMREVANSVETRDLIEDEEILDSAAFFALCEIGAIRMTWVVGGETVTH